MTAALDLNTDPEVGRRTGRRTGRPRVIAVVVTYNRLELLRQCLGAIAAQSRPPDETIVIDNASTDGTAAAMSAQSPQVTLISMKRNLGGAGGFHEGIRAAYARHADWIWLLDDDTIARADALAELLGGLDRADGLPAPALLASRVNWRDGEPHPMNMPIVRRRHLDLLVGACERGLLPLRASTFVSLLLGREAVAAHGLPLRQFFYQADDIEYTSRILRGRVGYLVPESIVEHRTKLPHTALSDGDGRKFYYHARNTLFMARGASWTRAEKPQLVWVFLESSARHLRANRFSAASVRTVLRALIDAMAKLEPARHVAVNRTDGRSTSPSSSRLAD